VKPPAESESGAPEAQAHVATVSGAASIRGKRKKAEQKAGKHFADATELPRVDWSCADPEKWEYIEKEFAGGYSYRQPPTISEEAAPIEEGLAKLKDNPLDFLGIFYQANMTEWPADQQKYNLVSRTKSGFVVQEQEGGGFTWVRAKYQALDPDVEIDPKDEFTDGATYSNNVLPDPLKPGRGQGIADVPMLKIVGNAQPGDVAQGGVGDCWLLSAISALAEFDGTIRHLYRKTPDLDSLPANHSNSYTVSLYNLENGSTTGFEPVDVVVDERLCSRHDGAGLLGAEPTLTGELWVCYLEKAVAAHCGGWDQINGGQCVHAWRLLVGCREQYTFTDSDGSGYGCYGAFNPNTDEYETLANSPHAGFQGMWPMKWPEVGGGGGLDLKVNANEMFERMCCWDDSNFIMCAGTKAGSDTNDTDGIVDGHAYTILSCIDSAGGSKYDMVKVRNPWGKGEFKSGMWDDDGPGWGQHPEVEAACKPKRLPDGIFWLDKEEFFKYFKTIYLCAKDMAEHVKEE